MGYVIGSRLAGLRVFLKNPAMPGREKLAEFTAWCQNCITGDETFRSGLRRKSFFDYRTRFVPVVL